MIPHCCGNDEISILGRPHHDWWCSLERLFLSRFAFTPLSVCLESLFDWKLKVFFNSSEKYWKSSQCPKKSFDSFSESWGTIAQEHFTNSKKVCLFRVDSRLLPSTADDFRPRFDFHQNLKWSCVPLFGCGATCSSVFVLTGGEKGFDWLCQVFSWYMNSILWKQEMQLLS